jgi:hypothetical protein
MHTLFTWDVEFHGFQGRKISCDGCASFDQLFLFGVTPWVA